MKKHWISTAMIALALCQSVWCQQGWANENSTSYSVIKKPVQSRFSLGLFSQLSQFQRSNQSFSGWAVELLAAYSITERFGVNVNFSQAISSNGGVSVLYSAIRSGIFYTLIGSQIKEGSEINVNGKSSVSFLSSQRPSLTADLGFENVFFNGTSRVTPATGASLGLRYDHDFWILRLSWMARYGQLVISSENVSLMTAGIGALYRF